MTKTKKKEQPKVATKPEAPTPAAIPAREFETAALDSIKPHPRNYRTHPEVQLEHLAASIKANGQYRPIVVANDGTILAGHGIALACRRLGMAQVFVVRLPYAPNDPAALKVVAGDNEVTALGEVDDRLLAELLREINTAAGDDLNGLLGTGMDQMQLANLALVSRPASEIKNIDEAAHWVGMPEYESKPAKFSLNVIFESEADRDRFMVEHKFKPVNKHGASWAMYWPEKDKRDIASVRVVDGTRDASTAGSDPS